MENFSVAATVFFYNIHGVSISDIKVFIPPRCHVCNIYTKIPSSRQQKRFHWYFKNQTAMASQLWMFYDIKSTSMLYKTVMYATNLPIKPIAQFIMQS